MTALNACRYCGESDHLTVNPAYCDESYQVTPDFRIVRDEAGDPVIGEEDYAECLICNATAPLYIWNHPPGPIPNLREEMLRAWAEAREEPT